MLVVISPAKRLDWDRGPTPVTKPRFIREANRLAAHGRGLSLRDLKSMMGLSDDLARLNRDRFRTFSDVPDEQDTRAALFAFAGDTYLGFDAMSLDSDGLDNAQDRLRILSGLYGLLRPLDAIQPYRLEMGSRLKTRRGKSLYDFWGAEIASALNEDAAKVGAEVIINCASQEYFGAVDRAALCPRVVTPQFYEVKAGSPKMVSFFAKKARGAMARFVVERRVTSIDGLKDFDLGGYRFQPDTSTDDVLIFHRDAEASGRAA